jgi:hypothetical protein
MAQGATPPNSLCGQAQPPVPSPQDPLVQLINLVRIIYQVHQTSNVTDISSRMEFPWKETESSILSHHLSLLVGDDAASTPVTELYHCACIMYSFLCEWASDKEDIADSDLRLALEGLSSAGASLLSLGSDEKAFLLGLYVCGVTASIAGILGLYD